MHLALVVEQVREQSRQQFQNEINLLQSNYDKQTFTYRLSLRNESPGLALFILSQLYITISTAYNTC